MISCIECFLFLEDYPIEINNQKSMGWDFEQNKVLSWKYNMHTLV